MLPFYYKGNTFRRANIMQLDSGINGTKFQTLLTKGISVCVFLIQKHTLKPYYMPRLCWKQKETKMKNSHLPLLMWFCALKQWH